MKPLSDQIAMGITGRIVKISDVHRCVEQLKKELHEIKTRHPDDEDGNLDYVYLSVLLKKIDWWVGV